MHPVAVECQQSLAQWAHIPRPFHASTCGCRAGGPERDKPSIDDVLTRPVHQGGADDWTRFAGASAAIGHYIRLVHDGRITPDDGWEAIRQYNAAMLRPSWPLERLKAEADRLWARHIEKNGPPLIRAATAARAPAGMPAFTLGALLDDTSPMPADIIAPRLLTPGGLLVLGGAPKVGKSDFLISLLVHMAAGAPFLGFTPPRPLRVFYLQAEIQYHYLRERLQEMRIEPAVLEAARHNLVATPKLRLLLDEKGIALAVAAIAEHFAAEPPDITCLDPIRNLFDGGPEGGGENDNAAMMFFLTERVEVLREAVNPDGGLILAHHTRKLTKQQVKDDPFLALSGASALCGFYTSGLIMHPPDEDRSERRLEIDAQRPGLPAKLIDKFDGRWAEIDRSGERLVRRDIGERLDAERVRKHDVILGILLDEALDGRLRQSQGAALEVDRDLDTLTIKALLDGAQEELDTALVVGQLLDDLLLPLLGFELLPLGAAIADRERHQEDDEDEEQADHQIGHRDEVALLLDVWPAPRHSPHQAGSCGLSNISLSVSVCSAIISPSSLMPPPRFLSAPLSERSRSVLKLLTNS
jgi:hypothetical protein